ncbi:MAG TPA: acyltransferase [Micromonosporaceae bacterium]|jgi:peptidoglycan/LPS O-acetylase OafA/YrhL
MQPSRLRGLDGIRGLAALFVVIDHIYLRAFPGYPVDNAPWWAGWFIYGRFAVVVFIVLSGFSLSVAPARHDWRLGGVSTFARRRAWRILPPYWAALVFSVLMTWFVVAQPGWPEPTGRSIVVNAALLQDAIVVPSPNRAFWSIAIEAQLYILLPLMLLTIRHFGRTAMVSTVALAVITLGLAAPYSAQIQYTLDLAVLFAVGVAAAGIVRAGERVRGWPWRWFALIAAVPVVALILVKGSVWTIDNFFWVDIAWAPAIALLLVAVATGRPRLLDSRPARGLGRISYSLYLTHAPIVIAVYYGVVEGRVAPGVPTFFVLIATVVPLTVGFAAIFASVFELPFQRHRGWAALRDAARRRTPEPEPEAPAVARVS